MVHFINDKGQVIRATKVMWQDKKVAITRFDNAVYLAKGIALENTVIPLDMDTISGQGMNMYQFEEFLLKASVLKQYAEYVETSDLLGWKVATGSTNSPTRVRIVMPSLVVGNELNTGSDLDQLLKAMEPLSVFVRRGSMSSVQYLEELYPTHEGILTQYPDILIDIHPDAKFSVEVLVTENNLPVTDLPININSVDYTTDAEGKVTVELPFGTFPYSVTFADATEQSGNIEVGLMDSQVTIAKEE